MPLIFFSFRLMVALGFFFIATLRLRILLAARQAVERHRLFLKVALWTLPLPWLAAEIGWIVAENGRQPWVIEGTLPTFLGASSLAPGQVTLSLIGFVVFYSALAIVDAALMLRVARQGPDGWFQADSHASADATPAVR